MKLRNLFFAALGIFVFAACTETPEPPVTDDPETDFVLTVKQAIDLGLSREHNVFTGDKYYVTGVITEVYNTTYGNMRITDEDGNILTLYGTHSADGELRYDAMEVKPVAGDTITIYGVIGQYNGVPQVKDGWIVAHTVGEHQPEPPVEPEPPAVAAGVKPEVGVAYVFTMYQQNANKTVYLAGGMNNYYMATTENVSEALNVYIEETTGGYYFYCYVDGVKTYINMIVDGTHVNGAYEATATTVYTIDETNGRNTLVANVNGAAYEFGTRNDKSYTTVGPVATANNGFICQFATVNND